jgi:sporulation protein YlmC with PRC-barrel domain
MGAAGEQAQGQAAQEQQTTAQQPGAGQQQAAVRQQPAEARESNVTSAVDQRAGMTPVAAEQIRVENLTGSDVYGANDENIGSVSDVLLTRDGGIDALVVDVGGFLGIGTHTVAIGMDNLEIMSDGDESWRVYTPFTQEQLESQPEYDEERYAQERDQQRMIAR